MYTIRNYKDSDYDMLSGWWHDSNERAPSRSLTPIDTTYILEVDGTPLLSICLMTTNMKGACFIENFVGNPNMKKERKQYAQTMWDYASDKAKELGYERVIAIPYKAALAEYYKTLGMTQTLDSLISLVKEL
jgi:hypothetical protein